MRPIWGGVLRLTLLSPEIPEWIAEGRQPTGKTMAELLKGFPVVWAEQRAVLIRWPARNDCRPVPLASQTTFTPFD
jgi:hypothetical protein